MAAPLSSLTARFKADVIIELPKYVSESGTLNSFYRARVSKGLILERWHSQGNNEPYLAGIYRVVHSGSERQNRYQVFWSLKGYPKMKVPKGPIRDEVVSVAGMLVKYSKAMTPQTRSSKK